jgi:hypothetical protein
MNKNFDFLKQYFNNKFPENECIIQNEQESDVFDGCNWYVCLIINRKLIFDEAIEIKILKPYMAVDAYNDNNGKMFYGWIDKWGNVYDDFQRPVHDDNRQVIGYRKIVDDKEE